MRGSRSIEKEASGSNGAARAVLGGLVTMALVGAASGVVVTYARWGLGMPGHKALLWMTPVVAGRLLTRSWAGCTVGGLASVGTTLGLGGHLGGGAGFVFLIGAAGAVLDTAILWVERRGWGGVWAMTTIGLAGMLGNWICMVKRLSFGGGDTSRFWFGGGASLRIVVFYAGFGLAAGVLGAGMAWAVDRRRRRERS